MFGQENSDATRVSANRYWLFVRLLLVTISFISGSVAIAQSPSLDDALAAYDRKDYTAAFSGFKTYALNGNRNAQLMLSKMYDNGMGVPKDEQQAVFWIQKSAQAGNDTAQLALSTRYESGLGVLRDKELMLFWLNKSAQAGNAKAQVKLGEMYEHGDGVPQNDLQALFWLRKSAERGNSHAQWNLGYRYTNGQGVPQDIQLGYFWCLLAGVYASNAQEVATAQSTRTLAEVQLTAQQRADANALARDWKPNGQSDRK